MSEIETALRAVVEAALRWENFERNSMGNIFPKEHVAGLLFACRTLREMSATNEPTGDILTRTWAEVPAGWFVKAPDGRLFEVLATRREDGELPRQMVTLNIDGQGHEFPRDPAGEVWVKKGSLAPERDAVLKALTDAFGSVQVLADGGQFS